MLAAHSSSRASIASLPDAALLHIFQLLCDSSPSETPGTCWLAPVCRRWRDVSCQVKRLRVLLWGQFQQQQADSRAAWLRRYVHQVRALVIIGNGAAPMLRALVCSANSSGSSYRPSSLGEFSAAPGIQEVATAAAGKPLQLERLVIKCWDLGLEVYHDILQPLLGALPHLQHLDLLFYVQPGRYKPELEECFFQAILAALAPLQHNTSLTSLVLQGPHGLSPTQQQQILAQLPASLRRLHHDWYLQQFRDGSSPSTWTLEHLPALEMLTLRGSGMSILAGSFTSLPAQCQLALPVVSWHNLADDGGLTKVYKEQLVSLGLVRRWDVEDEEEMGSGYGDDTDSEGEEEEAQADEAPPSERLLPQLTSLRSLALKTKRVQSTRALLQQAPPLQELRVVLPEQLDPGTGSPLPQSALAACSPSILRHYNHLSQLQRLKLTVHTADAECPVELGGLVQLQQLAVNFKCWCSSQQPDPNPWAQSVARLVNLQVLQVPVELTTCRPPRWLTGLTRLEVLEVKARMEAEFDQESAAAHLSSLLEPRPPEGAPAAEAPAAPAGGVQLHRGGVVLVCFNDRDRFIPCPAADLQSAVAAAVPVLPPSKHLFQGSWKEVQECGVELWPAPVAARLQQLL